MANLCTGINNDLASDFVGWGFKSIAQHGDNGCMYHDQGFGIPSGGQPWHRADTAGVGCMRQFPDNREMGFFWATLNRGLQGSQPSATFQSPDSVIAAISLKGQVRLRVNFGRAPFVGNFKTDDLVHPTVKIPHVEWAEAEPEMEPEVELMSS